MTDTVDQTQAETTKAGISEAVAKVCPNCGGPMRVIKAGIVGTLTFCPPCSDKAEAERVAQSEIDTAAMNERRIALQWRKARGVFSEEHRAYTFETWVPVTASQRSSLATVDEWAHRVAEWRDREANPKPWVILHGAPGTGKTTLAACAYHRLVDLAVPVRAVKAGELVSEILRRTKKRTDAYDAGSVMTLPEAVADSLSGYRAIIIDDLCATETGQRERDAWGVFFDAAYLAGVPLLVTTNKNPDDLFLLLDNGPEGRVRSRAKQMTGGGGTPCTGHDYRGGV